MSQWSVNDGDQHVDALAPRPAFGFTDYLPAYQSGFTGFLLLAKEWSGPSDLL